MLGEMWWILLAEDEEDVREMFRNAIVEKIDSMGLLAHIVEVENGSEALAKASSRAFDCIVSDLRMPTLSGEDVVRALQAQPLNFNTPIVVVSAYAREEFQKFCKEYEHIRYLNKPCFPHEVADAVIKELTYGKRDERVSVHLLNPFVKTVKAKLGRESDASLISIGKPMIKPFGKSMAGDVHCIMTLSSEFSKACFALSVDQALLLPDNSEDEASKALLKEKSRKLLHLSKEFALEVIENAMPNLKICLGGTPHLVGLTQILGSNKNDPNMPLLTNTVAVTIYLETEGKQGKLYLSALSAQDFSILR